LKEFLAAIDRAKKERAKSIFFFEGLPPYIKGTGLQRIEGLTFEKKDAMRFLESTLTDWQLETFFKEKEIDFSVEILSSRFRVNCFLRNGSIGIVLRPIPEEVPPFEELLLPEVLKTFVRMRQGLFLVTGPTGSGKSTTLASLIDLINEERSCHIVTIEDPIEFIFRPKKSIISQREIGRDTKSFSEALRRVLREDPDVILVGEIRDRETMKVVIELAETGHLVLSTLHTRDTVQTVNRIIDFFLDEERTPILAQLSDVLLGVCSQRLIPRIDKIGFVCACEVLKVTEGVRNLIREGKVHQIPHLMESQKKEGMIKFDSSILELAGKGYIAIPEAIEHAKEEKIFIEKVKDVRPRSLTSYIKRGTITVERENTLYQIDTSDIEFMDSSGMILYTPSGLFFKEGPYKKTNEQNFIVDYSILHGRKDSFGLGAFFSMEYFIRDVRVVKESYILGVSLTLESAYEVQFPTPFFELTLENDWHSLLINVPSHLRGKSVKIVAIVFDKDIREMFIRNARFF